MGMYTELYLSCKLKKNIPETDLPFLQYLFAGGDFPELALPRHRFFNCDRWAAIGRGASYYFVPAIVRHFEVDSISENYILITRSDLKNYDDEISHFFDWITPFLDMDDGEHLGHFRYEERENPTLLFFRDGKVVTEVHGS